MNSYIAFLRGINVGQQNKLHMQALRDVFSRLGLKNIQTYLQSGNVIFASTEPRDTHQMEWNIEQALRDTFGTLIPVIVRTPEQLERVLQNNPFLKAGRHPEHLYVTFLKESVSLADLDVQSPNADGDELFAGVQEIFLNCPHGYGRTKLNNAFFERKLKSPATTRNWKTVTTLYQLAGQAAET